MPRFNFVGPGYQSQSQLQDAERLVNMYLEGSEVQASTAPAALYPTPGLTLFTTLPDGGPVRAETITNGRAFAIGASNLYELAADGTVTPRGAVQADGITPASLTPGIGYLVLASGGKAYYFNLTTNVLTEIDTTGGPALQGPVLQMFFMDGFYIALLANSSRFQITLDVTAWDPLDIAQISIFAGNVVGGLVDHREFWMWGTSSTAVYADTGNPIFPLEPVQGSIIEDGSNCAWASVKADNSLFWIGQDDRGFAVAKRANGYTPLRVSNHSIENIWQGYAATSDAIGYSYQDQGHTFWVIYFPTAGKTWVYDVGAAPGMGWHERTYYNAGVIEAHRSRCHVLAFNKHLVGDRANGKIYSMSIAAFDDVGIQIQRIRRGPNVGDQKTYMYHRKLQIDLETAVLPLTPLVDNDGNLRAPQMILRWSDDGCKTWSNDYLIDCGMPGDYLARVIKRQLGRSRSRVYEVVMTDPVPWRIVDAYLNNPN